MSEAKLCDICNKPIEVKRSSLFNHESRKMCKVTIKQIEEGYSLAGYFCKKECLDVCPICMEKFIEFANAKKRTTVHCDYMPLPPKEKIERKALELWNELQNAEMSCGDFLATQEKIITLFCDKSEN